MKKIIKQALPIILVFFGLAFSSSNYERQGVLLRYNPKVGETVSTKTIMDVSMNVDGEEIRTSTLIKTDMTAISKADSLVTVQAKIKSINIRSIFMGQNNVIDSDHLEDADLEETKRIKEYVNKAYIFVYDIYGNVVCFPKDYPQEQGITTTYPKEMVYEGSHWTQRAETVSNGISFRTFTTYIVKKITEKTTEIEIEGNLVSDRDTGDLVGTMIIDNETGLPIFSILQMSLAINIDGTSISTMWTTTITQE